MRRPRFGRGFMGTGGYGGYGGYGYGQAPQSGCGCGCLSGVVTLVAIAIVLVIALPIACSRYITDNSSGHTVVQDYGTSAPRTSTRQKLAASEYEESSEWIDDQAGWLDKRKKVISAMRSFYEMTGVQPYLVICDEIDGNKDYDESDVERYMRSLYDELYEDDGHMILLFCEPYENEYDPYLLVGSKAAKVIDTDGEDVIYDAIDYWYTDTSLDDDAYFSRIFIASANKLMRGTDFSEFR